MMGVNVCWVLAPERLSLETHEVHVWRARLDHDAWDLSSLSEILHMEEVARARRFLRPRDRDRFIICRAGLRLVLSRYLNVCAGAIRFKVDEAGKPWLQNHYWNSRLEFSVSRSANLALYSVSSGREIGVDIERLDIRSASAWVADRYLPQDEVNWLKRMPADAAAEEFFRAWTRLEAHMKALGVGLAGAQRAIIEDRSGWAFYDLTPAVGYVGTLVAAGSKHRVALYELPPPKIVIS